MTHPGTAQPFESIESAHEFMVLLEETIADARRELENELDEARKERAARHAEALALAVFKVNQLGNHVQKSRRILKDLRTIRRLLANSRAAAMAAV